MGNPVINGFICGTRAEVGVKVFQVPGTGVLPGRIPVKLALRADVAPLLLEYFRWFHAEIEPLDIPPLDDWGHAERSVRGSTKPSFHWAGIAGDGNATKHPLGVRGTFTTDQRNRMKAKADTLGLRLGEFYTGRVDGMHAEVIVTLERALALVRALQSPAGTPVTLPPSGDANSPIIRMGSKGDKVREAQNLLNSRGFGLTADGSFGPATTAAVKAFQTSAGITADGIVGPTTWARLRAPGSAASPAPAVSTPTRQPVVRKGSTGAAVSTLQRFLGIAADGKFGPATEAAVRRYQQMRGLAADGVVGPATWGAMGL
jgi:peptidoglycan hydrolase-like protein with peptidoglycan-binding domain